MLEDYNKTTAAARPPSTPAPRPATFCGLAFFVAEAAAEDEVEAWLATLEATEEADETAEETEPEALDAADEALLSADEALEVIDVAAAPAEDAVDGGVLEETVEVQSCETAVGRPVTPEILQKPIA